MSEKIIIVVSARNGNLKISNAELIAKAQSIDEQPAAVIIGNDAANFTTEVASLGTFTQYICEDERTNTFSGETFAEVISIAAAKHGATQIWFTSGESAKAVAPLLSGKLNGAMGSDMFDLQVNNGELTGMRNAYAGKVIETFQPLVRPFIAVFLPGSFPPDNAKPGRENVVNIDFPATDVRTRIKDIMQQVSQDLDLTEAKRIVGVGRGAKDQAGVDFVVAFAKQIKAVIGGSRAVIDAGWLSKHLQIGQTGKMISPTLYICVGISGAIQHQAGIGKSKVILAINKDPEAPIFGIANYGIVGDMFQILPELEKEIISVTNA